jgi:hypothetical protein
MSKTDIIVVMIIFWFVALAALSFMWWAHNVWAKGRPIGEIESVFEVPVWPEYYFIVMLHRKTEEVISIGFGIMSIKI